MNKAHIIQNHLRKATQAQVNDSIQYQKQQAKRSKPPQVKDKKIVKGNIYD